jgi:hypothetical protein
LVKAPRVIQYPTIAIASNQCAFRKIGLKVAIKFDSLRVTVEKACGLGYEIKIKNGL